MQPRGGIGALRLIADQRSFSLAALLLWVRLRTRRECSVMISSIIVGLIAGWLAGKMMRGDGYGFVCDILLGLVGGVVGGWMFGAFGIHAHHMVSSIIVATLGASALVFAARAATGELFDD
jgi:uncharacterized membrane protein YeaQ/YmgE (transglycosylase-associated protein family)